MKPQQQDVKTLRNKLPAKGYVSLIKSKTPKRITHQQIRNFFSNRQVNIKDSEAIVKSALETIKAIEKRNKTIRRLIQKA